jgi:restriction system protein
MPIPDFQTIMLPLLQLLIDGKEHSRRETIEYLARQFKLSEIERKELLPSGRQAVFDNRVAWSFTHLKVAKLIENTQRGVVRITDRGKEVLRDQPQRIDKKLLMKFSEYAEKRDYYLRNRKGQKDNEIIDEQDGSKTPEEQIEGAYENLRNNLVGEIISQLKESSPLFFEKVVVEVLVKMGYGGSLKDAGEAIGKSGDEGIDGIIKEDRLGLDIIYIQAKKWENTISRPEIQKFAGALQGKKARKGIFITTSDFSKSAQEYAASIENKIILIDGNSFAHLMIDYNVGVSTEATYELKRIDYDFFAEN